MARYRVVYAPEAEAQLLALYRYLETEASAETALGFTQEIIDRCESLGDLPARGAPRDHIRPGLRITSFRRVVIAYAARADEVRIVMVFYGGQDYEAILGER